MFRQAQSLLVFSAIAVASAACTGGSEIESSSAPASSSPTLAVTSTRVPSTTETPRISIAFDGALDPRRGSVLDLDDPLSRDAALMAMAIGPEDLATDLSYLKPATPVAWEPGSGPGFFSDNLPIEAPGPEASYPGVKQGYRAVYERPFGVYESGVENFIVEIISASDPMRLMDEQIAEVETAEGLAVKELKGRDGERRFLLSSDVTDSIDDEGSADFSAVLAVVLVDEILASVVIVGQQPTELEQLLDQAVKATADRIDDVLSGDFGYGPFDDVSLHTQSARWVFVEGVSNDGEFRSDGTHADKASTCSIGIGGLPNVFEFAFDSNGRGVASFAGVTNPSSAGAWPQFGTCGRSYPGIPAYFSHVESRSVGAFLRDVPDLEHLTGDRVEFNGHDTVRFDISVAYQTYLDRFEAEIVVERFDIWLHAVDGWIAGWSVELVADPDELARQGFGEASGPGSGRFKSDFSVTAVNTTQPPTTPLDIDAPRVPGDSRVVFTSERLGGTRDIFVLEPTGEVRMLTTHPNGDELAVLSPDGATVAFTSRRPGNDTIFLVDIDGFNQRRLTAPVSDGGDSWPSWSPDSRSIVFGSDRECCEDDLWVINADGTGLRMLFGDPDASEIWPSWSPDGDLIAFVSDMDTGDSGVGEVYTVRADGSNLTRVTDDATGGYQRPSWSPDGSRLLVSSDENGRTVMYTMDPDGSNRAPIATGDVTGAFGVYTPDGDYVIFTDGAYLWSVGLDGTDLQRLTAHPGADLVPSAGPSGQGGVNPGYR